MTRRKDRLRIAVPVLVAVLPGASLAQSVLHTFAGIGAVPYERHAYSVDGAGDLNGDGFADVVVGTQNGNYVRTFSGKDGSVLHYVPGAPSDGLGVAVGGAGDVDGDGRPDFLVGAVGRETALVFSGADGSVLRTLAGAPSGSALGWSVSGAGDVNADGTPDLIVGAPSDSTGGTYAGSAWVYSGSTGNVLYSFLGDALSFYLSLGWSVSGADDPNQDGFSDLFVGSNANYARVFSGKDGSIVYTFQEGSGVGYSVADAGDVDADGVPDLITGDPGWITEVTFTPGFAKIYSGFDGATLYTLTKGSMPGSQFGSSVDGLGDLDGDGYGEVIVGASGFFDYFYPGDIGFVTVFSGGDGLPFYVVQGSGSYVNYFGASVARAGDVNADGTTDFIVGEPFLASQSQPGTAWVYSAWCLGSTLNYGSGLAGAGGFEPSLALRGCPGPALSPSIEILNGLGGTLGLLLIGIAPVTVPALGGTILVAPVFSIPHSLGGVLAVPGTGTFSYPLTLPNNLLLVGVSYYFQSLYLDPFAPKGVSITAGLQMTVG